MNASGSSADDLLFVMAEEQAHDFSLFPQADAMLSGACIEGLVSPGAIQKRLQFLANLDVDSYIAHCIEPAQLVTRPAVPAVIATLGGNVTEVTTSGPYYSCILEIQFSKARRKIGIIAQNRTVKNGAWMPEHHLLAVDAAHQFSRKGLPILTLMDTPGADAGTEANRQNQAHAISKLIAQMSSVCVPTIGVIFGLGYSGGAIPLATSNVILSVRDGVFNTIQPQGLASIARKYSLSWQECAKHVGVSSFELYQQGNIDGVIDYAPGEEGEKLENFRQALITGIEFIEQKLLDLVQSHEYIMDHYKLEVQRYIERSAAQSTTSPQHSLLNFRMPPSEHPNVFGSALRHLRYLGIRKRIRPTTKNQYGRLAEQEMPGGDLYARVERESRAYFHAWLQNPDRLIYDDTLAKALRSYKNKKRDLEVHRNRFSELLFGAPKKNYEDARTRLLTEVAFYLYNRWKSSAHDNFRLLVDHLENNRETSHYIQAEDIVEPNSILQLLAQPDVEAHYLYLREQLSHEGRKLLRASTQADMPEATARIRLATEFNRMIRAGVLTAQGFTDILLPKADRRHASKPAAGDKKISYSRWLLEVTFPEFIRHKTSAIDLSVESDLTLLDILQHADLRADFVAECRRFLVFGWVYDHILGNLTQVAREADQTGALSAAALNSLLTSAYEAVAASHADFIGAQENAQDAVRKMFLDWCQRFAAMPKRGEFLKAAEEWKKTSFPHLSDTLFVVVTFVFEHLIPDYFTSHLRGKKYAGKIRPRRIGRSKDFWNRLTIAYRDLQIQSILQTQKRQHPITPQKLIDAFFQNYEALDEDLLSSDPVHFPGFRLAIEDSLNRNLPPCGVVTGIADFKSSDGLIKVGVVLSNIAFQAGAFDMASATKFCSLLVVCAKRRIPVVCFISSGGMQTKEGAGALFPMAAVNDRLTRFIGDLGLPVIVFGFGDCAGGAQASFVTHPLVHTYYFSGTNMPFAGQIVVSSHLPSMATLSNYLVLVPDSMQGLVCHPFLPEQDIELRKIDPDIPIPKETVQDVVADVIANRYQSRDYSSPTALAALDSEQATVPLKPVRRVLIHARGCTAVKLIRIAQQQNIEIVLVQSDPDMDSVAVDMLLDVDRVICIGGNTPDESYLNGLSVVRIAEREGADSLHPGIGFLSENSQFAELCRHHGINYIGPWVNSMESMGNKSNAINTALRVSVPAVPGSHGVLASEKLALDLAEKIGFPVLIKAVHGGGGKGIQLVERREDFIELFYQVQAEAKNAFGNGDVYLEKYIVSLRHIEVQLLRDSQGNTSILGLRDCSIQRNKQKIVEESGTPSLPAKLRRAVRGYSRAIADEIGYLNAGTVEFIHDLKGNALYFMEMNTRLQVEHPVTDKVSGVDLVAKQFDVAGGGSIAGLQIAQNGYAIEVRVNAERAELRDDGAIVFRPAPGKVQHCLFPDMVGIDVISTIASGKTVPPFYDSLVAQIIAHDCSRDAAADKLLAYLNTVEIKGIATNIPLLKRILQDDCFRSGRYDTGYLEDLMSRIDGEAFLQEMQEFSGTRMVIDREALQIQGSDELKVMAPTTGTIYLAPAPTEAPYVAEGDVIDTRHTLCQIEAMKVFAPISLASFNQQGEPLYPENQKYRIERIQYESGNQVNVGDLLFVVIPAPSSAGDEAGQP